MKAPFLFLVSLCIYYSAFCQNVGIGTNTPKNKLHIAGGLRVDTLTNGLDSGILRHDKDGVVYSLKFTGNSSDVLRGNGSFGPGDAASSGWTLSGNSGTNPANNFIGTTDIQPLKFRVNGLPAGVVDPTNLNVSLGYLSLPNTSGSYNTAIGFQSLYANNAGSSNTAVGVESLFKNVGGGHNSAYGQAAMYNNTTGNINSAFGQESLYSNTSGLGNTAIGSRTLYTNDVGFGNTANGTEALYSNTNGFYNTAIGQSSMYGNTTGYFNTAVGYTALYTNTTGIKNTANGHRALYSNTTGYSNVAIGTEALYSNTNLSHLVAIGDSALFNNKGGAGSLGIRNTAIGSKSLYTNESGQSNTAIGFRSLYFNDGNDNTANGMFALINNTTGSSNTALGAAALLSNTTGSGNTALGAGANVSNNLENATAIGYNAQVASSNSMVLGSTGASAVKVGIGVTTPIVTLHVKGTANFFSGANSHTGNFFNGTSNFDGIEMVSADADAYMSVQRTGGGYGLHVTKKNALSNNGLVGFLVNDILVGAIITDGTTNTYYSSPSDSRLKENIQPTQFGLNTLMKLNVADYNYKADSKKMLRTGFIAQDLYKLYPQAVQTGGENEKTNPWMIDYSKITPLLVKSIQQQQQIIEEQKNEIDILKTQVADLINTVKTIKNK